jgi:hypothetical protein
VGNNALRAMERSNSAFRLAATAAAKAGSLLRARAMASLRVIAGVDAAPVVDA